MSNLQLTPKNVPEEVYRRLVRLLVKKATIEERTNLRKTAMKKKIAQ